MTEEQIKNKCIELVGMEPVIQADEARQPGVVRCIFRFATSFYIDTNADPVSAIQPRMGEALEDLSKLVDSQAQKARHA